MFSVYVFTMQVITETPRMILRAHEDRDLDDVARMSGDMRVMRYMGGETYTREQIADRMGYYQKIQRETGWSMWVMQCRETGAYLGECGLIPVARPGCNPRDYYDRGPQIEVGYRVDPAHQGKGLAQEAARAALGVGFRERGLNRILAVTNPENIPSQVVLLAIGMRFIGQNESYFSPTVRMFELTAREFGALV